MSDKSGCCETSADNCLDTLVRFVRHHSQPLCEARGEAFRAIGYLGRHIEHLELDKKSLNDLLDRISTVHQEARKDKPE